jgi:transaldolase
VTIKVSEKLKAVGQSLWLAHLSRLSIGDESLRHTFKNWSITGMAFSPQAICQALSDTDAYDHAITKKLKEGMYGPPLVYNLIFEDVRQAAALLRSVHDETDGLEGWAVMPVSPLFSNECNSLAAKYKQIWDQIERPNVLLLLPALPDHLSEVEELVFAGIPINIANVYSADQFTAVAQSCLAGIKRRLSAGHTLTTSIFITIEIGRLVMALREKVTHERARTLALAIARTIYRALHDFYDSPEWDRMNKEEFQPLRLVWDLSGDLDKAEVDSGLTGSLIAPCTTVSLPQNMSTRIANHNDDDEPMPADGGDCDQVLTNFAFAGLDAGSETDKLQLGHCDWLSKKWALLLENVASKSAEIVQLKASASSTSGIATEVTR